MFKLQKDAAVNWQNTGGKFIPQNIDIGCPYCKRSPTHFALINGTWNFRPDSWYCKSTCPACNKTVNFWLLLRQKQETVENAPNVTDIYMDPDPPLNIPYDPSIDEFSPKFSKIYNQAVQAELHGLDDLIGMGYRKALEFLIKDWAIFENPDKKDEIVTNSVGYCIKNFISNPTLRKGIERTVWLGNDETHYARKFEDRDIEDMKRFLSVTLYGFAAVITMEKSDEIMPKK